MVTHSSTLAWKIPWTEEPGRLRLMGSLRVGHDWVTPLSLLTFMHWRRKWQPTPVFLPGESQGRQSLVSCHLWGRTVGHDWSDLAAAVAVSIRKLWVKKARNMTCIGKEMATHSSTLAWKIPWTEEPGWLLSMRSQRVGHDWVTSLSLSLSRNTEVCTLISEILKIFFLPTYSASQSQGEAQWEDGQGQRRRHENSK